MRPLVMIFCACLLTLPLMLGCQGKQADPAADRLAFTGDGALTADGPTLDDGSRYSLLALPVCERALTLEITMASTAFAPYLLVIPTAYEAAWEAGHIVAQGGTSSGTGEARLTVIVPAGAAYTVVFNAADAQGVGAYQYTVREAGARTRRIDVPSVIPGKTLGAQ